MIIKDIYSESYGSKILQLINDKEDRSLQKNAKDKVLPRFELGLQDSESWVLTVTLQNLACKRERSQWRYNLHCIFVCKLCYWHRDNIRYFRLYI